GVGVNLALLLSNISTEFTKRCRSSVDKVHIVVTIFERNNTLLNGSASETAFMLHRGGYEYSLHAETMSTCRMAGDLYVKMFPDLFPPTKSGSTNFLINSDTSKPLTADTQKETRDKAKNIVDAAYGTPEDNRLKSVSFDEIDNKTIEEMGAGKIISGIKSSRDISRDVLKNNINLKNEVKRRGNIKVKTNYKVKCVKSSVDRSGPKKYIVIGEDGEPYENVFDHVVMAAWCGTEEILNTPELGRDLNPVENLDHNASDAFPRIKESRAIALYTGNMRRVKSTHTLVGGNLIHKLSGKLAAGCGCEEGASYPLKGKRDIPLRDAHVHGWKIFNRLNANFSNKYHGNLVYIGTKIQETLIPSYNREERAFVPPMVDKDGRIIAIPSKLTYSASLAVLTLNVIFEQMLEVKDVLSASHRGLIEKMMGEVSGIARNDCVYTGIKLPEYLKLKMKSIVSKNEILRESLLFMGSFILNKKGVKLRENIMKKLNEKTVRKSRKLIKLRKQVVLRYPFNVRHLR
ncbi:MAG: hypothetical protein NWS47_00735, partial [Alphaproteobacteria bacterium]|nr:hypothetical protein [Alphaproteobacteria bacterium]